MLLTRGNILDMNNVNKDIDINISDVIMSDGHNLKDYLNIDNIKYIYNNEDAVNKESLLYKKEVHSPSEKIVDVINSKVYVSSEYDIEHNNMRLYINRELLSPWSTQTLDFGSVDTSALGYESGILTSAYGDSKASEYDNNTGAFKAIDSTQNAYINGGSGSSWYGSIVFGKTNVNTLHTEMYKNKVWSTKQNYPRPSQIIPSVSDNDTKILTTPIDTVIYDNKLKAHAVVPPNMLEFDIVANNWTTKQLVPYSIAHMIHGFSDNITTMSNSKNNNTSEYYGAVKFNGEVWKFTRVNGDLYTNKDNHGNNTSPCIITPYSGSGIIVIMPDQTTMLYDDDIFSAHYDIPPMDVLAKAHSSFDLKGTIVAASDLKHAIYYSDIRSDICNMYDYSITHDKFHIYDPNVSMIQFVPVQGRQSGVGLSSGSDLYVAYGKNKTGILDYSELLSTEITGVLYNIVDGGRISSASLSELVSGGYNNDSTALSTTSILNAIGVFESFEQLSIARYAHCGDVVDFTPVLYGGLNDSYIRNGEIYNGTTWAINNIMLPIEVQETGSTNINGIMYILSGMNAFGTINNIIEYNGTIAKISPMSNMNIPRHNHTSANVVGNGYSMTGGSNGELIIYNELFTGEVSYIINTINIPRKDSHILQLSNTIIVSGGIDKNDNDICSNELTRTFSSAKNIPGDSIINELHAHDISRTSRYYNSDSKLYDI